MPEKKNYVAVSLVINGKEKIRSGSKGSYKSTTPSGAAQKVLSSHNKNKSGKKVTSAKVGVRETGKDKVNYYNVKYVKASKSEMDNALSATGIAFKGKYVARSAKKSSRKVSKRKSKGRRSSKSKGRRSRSRSARRGRRSGRKSRGRKSRSRSRSGKKSRKSRGRKSRSRSGKKKVVKSRRSSRGGNSRMPPGYSMGGRRGGNRRMAGYY